MQIELNKTSELEATITVKVSPEDYLPGLQEELRKQRQKADIKGFRKGKVPMRMIKKMFGLRLLFNTVYRIATEAIQTYIKENEFRLLGEPLPGKGQKELDFDIDKGLEYEFEFDIGFFPEFELEGLSKDYSYDYFEVKIDENEVEKMIDDALLAHGDWEESQNPIEEGMQVLLDVKEVEPVRKKPHESTFPLVIDDYISEGFRALLTGKKTGDTVDDFDIFEISPDLSEEDVRYHYLALDEADAEFETSRRFTAKIQKVHKRIPAELNQAFCENWLDQDTEISTREELVEEVKNRLKEQWKPITERLLRLQMKTKLKELNDPPISNNYVQHLIESQSSEKPTEKELEEYIQSLKYSLILHRLIERYNPDPTFQEVKENIIKDLYNKFPFLMVNPEYMEIFLNETLKDRDKVSNAWNETKINQSLLMAKDDVNLNIISIDEDSFKKKVEELTEVSNTIEEEE